MTHDDIVFWCDEHAEELAKQFWESSAKVVGKTWEWPIPRRGNEFGRPAGYCDLAISIECDMPVNIIDSIAIDDWRSIRRKLLIEVKPRIESLGELLRQLQRYKREQSSRDCWRIVVCSLDDKHRRIIEEQGFGFVLPAGGQSVLGM